jgi:hypothetical protein
MNYEFYKNKFDRELSRRNDLDTAINNPVAGITIIVALTSYILSTNNFKDWNCFDCIYLFMIICSTITILISLYYVFLSNNNLFKGFNYLNFGLLAEYRKTELEINEFNKNINEDERIVFEEKIIEKIISFSDNHTEINDKRAYDLYLCRKYVVISFIITIINLISVTINNFKI